MSAERSQKMFDQSLGSTASALRRCTYTELCAELPESNQPSELHDGVLVMSPSPSFVHQQVVLRFFRQLEDWVASRGLGEVVTAPMDMVLSEYEVTQPDVLFIARERLGIIQRVVMGPADLAVEVISPGGGARDRDEKRELYARSGVKEYWIVDPEARTIEVLHLAADRYELVVQRVEGQSAESKLLPGFRVDMARLFSGGRH